MTANAYADLHHRHRHRVHHRHRYHPPFIRGVGVKGDEQDYNQGGNAQRQWTAPPQHAEFTATTPRNNAARSAPMAQWVSCAF